MRPSDNLEFPLVNVLPDQVVMLVEEVCPGGALPIGKRSCSTSPRT